MRRSNASRPTARAAACVATAVLALSACSGAEPLDVDGFPAGPCTDVSAALQQVDEVLRGLEEDDVEPRQAADGFREVQEVLAPVADSADGPVAESVAALTQRLGFYRIAVDTGGDDQKQSIEVRSAVDAVVEQCRPS